MQKVALFYSTTDTLRKKTRLRERTDRAWFSFYDIRPGNGAGLLLQPGACTGLVVVVEVVAVGMMMMMMMIPCMFSAGE